MPPQGPPTASGTSEVYYLVRYSSSIIDHKNVRGIDTILTREHFEEFPVEQGNENAVKASANAFRGNVDRLAKIPIKDWNDNDRRSVPRANHPFLVTVSGISTSRIEVTYI